MDFLEELKWRGMIQDKIPGVEDHLMEGPKVGYIGFDPTAASLTIGNYVQIMLLRLFQNAGHRPIFLMGGATGRVGDPSGKDQERQLKSFEELDANVEAQIKQAEKFLDFDSKTGAILENNLNFYKDMNVLDFLRDVGKTLTVNYMLSKDSVKNRLDTGLSFTEFSYQLLQGYDFLSLNKKYGCTLQMGGSDQWGNITTGTEFVRRSGENNKVYAVTTPLLTKSDGKKFGKSEEGNLWLSADLTSPYAFYQFWLNCEDSDLSSFTRYFTLKSREETEALEKEHENNPNALKKLLGEELTRRVHSDEAFEAAKDVSELLFGRSINEETLRGFTKDTLSMVASEIPSYSVDSIGSLSGLKVIDVLTENAAVFQSKGEARRAIQGNAVSINKVKISDLDHVISDNDYLQGGFIFIENGKKNKSMITSK